jgi:hypothetical protein
MRFFRFLQFDLLSFITGLIAGILGAWLGSRLRRRIALPSSLVKPENLLSPGKGPASLELRLRNEILRHAQTLHLAAPLFSLDEILIPPHLLLPAVPFDPEEAASERDFEAWMFPELPDWPELASAYGSTQVSLIEALGGGASLLLTGEPGAGKTAALAHLAAQLARREPGTEALGGALPLLVHAPDLSLPVPAGDASAEVGAPESALTSALSPLASAVAQNTPSIPLPRLVPLLEKLLGEGRALLLLDGLDELPPVGYQSACAYLRPLLGAYPRLQVIATAAPDYFPGLVELGFIPVSLAPWGERQRRELIQKWGALWRSAVTAPEGSSGVDPAILDGWLLQDTAPLSPLELTLKLWAAHAGDALGPQATDALEAYVRRMTGGDSKARTGLEAQAQDLVLAGTRLSARSSHPAVLGYLAALGNTNPEVVLAQPGSWAGKTSFLRFAARRQDTSWVQGFLERSSPPLQKNLLTSARWLGFPSAAPWQAAALRWLAMLVQNETAPLGLRFRALAGLAHSGSSGVSILFQGFLKAPEDHLRLLGALGAGLLRDPKLVEDLASLLQDQSLPVRRAAALALVKLGGGAALDAVASALLNGDEATRRAAAEALAVDPAEGHPLLREGSELLDLLVRRATVYGLRRVRQPWAVELLHKLQVEDPEWVVKNTATQALEDLAQEGRRIPQPPQALSETPWLIAFAGRQGIGIAPGRPAENLLLRALQERNPADQLAALETLRLHGSPAAIQPAEALLASDSEALRTAAFETLWRLSTQGCEI